MIMKKKYLKSMLVLFFTSTGLFAQTNIKWQQIFDTTVIPDGWRVIDADGSGSGLELVDTANTPENTKISAHVGQSFFWTSNVQNANRAGVIDEWLISPRISVIYAGDSLYFWAGANDLGFDDSIRVKISTTSNAIKDFTQELANFKVDRFAGNWQHYVFDLSLFDSMDIYFAINYYIKDGGPGGQHSDFVWIDHTGITGDPGSFNNAPSVIYLQEPADESSVELTSTSIDFRWSASHDIDGDSLEYTLYILNTLPQKQFIIKADTSFSYEWLNLLDTNQKYQWTVEVRDGVSRTASLDTFSFSLGISTAITGELGKFPKDIVLTQNYPNPFNPTTFINYELPNANYVDLSIYNIIGQKIVTLVSEEQSLGKYKVKWDATKFSSGIYYYQLRIANKIISKKMVLMK